MKEFEKSDFIADVIKALEDAEQRASQTPKSKTKLAKEAHSKLHYDFPASHLCSELLCSLNALKPPLITITALPTFFTAGLY